MSGIWVWIEGQGGKALSVSWEAIGLARSLADGMGEKVTALAFGEGAAAMSAEAIQYGADSAFVCEDASLNDFRLDPYASLLSKLAKEHGPKAILAGQTSSGSDLMAAAAVDLEAGLISDVINASVAGGVIDATVPVFSGKVLATVRVPQGIQMMTIRSRAFPAPAKDAGRSGAVETVAPAKGEAEIREKISGLEATQGGVSLTDAAIIVSGGRGLGGPEGFGPIEALARALGGAVGASRAVVDAGWIPYEHQVGQTGKTVSPDLYIAVGISGAVQHQAGMRTSKVIVAINKDADAPIFKMARFGIVDDWSKVVPAITAEAEKRLK